MSGNNTTGAFQGFSVVQPFLGATLEWLPALGTQELDDMINAFLPGPSSIQDKRAHISMDFFEYSRLTGENFKFYPVPAASSFSAATSSPASSTSLFDSGYASNFNVSPVMTESQWVESPSTFTPVSFDETNARSPASASKRTVASSSKQRTNDFASHPGMRIMTKDGRDVTNSASRGCKTKEQRDHAHLMRIIKACDSCRRKKVRCDPSHKKRTASQASATQAEQKTCKRSKKKAEAASADPPSSSINEFSLDFLNTEAFDINEYTFPTFETTADSTDDLWDQFVQQDPTLFVNDFTNYVPGDYSLFTDQLSHVSPSSGSSSTSPSQVYTPYTPTLPGPSPPTVVYKSVYEVSQGDPTLPYLNPGVPHGTDYVDFNLFSPPPDFSLDEEPQSVKKSGRRQRPAQSRSPVSGYENGDNVAAISSSQDSQADGLLPSESPAELQSFSPGLMSVSHVPTQAVQDIASPADVFHDSGSPVLEPSVSQRARGPDQHHTDRPRPGLEAYEPFYGVLATASQSDYSAMSAQSTATASLRRGTGYHAAGGDVTISPSLAVVTSPSVVASSSPASSSAPVSTTAVPSSSEYHQARVDSIGAVAVVAGVSPLPTDSQVSRRRVGDSQASVSPVLAQTVVDSAIIGLSARANVSVVSGSGQLVQCTWGVVQQSGVPQQGFVRSGVNAGPSLNAAVVATTLLSTSPVRRLLAGVVDKHQKQASSSWSSLVCSQLVVLGLVSYLLVCLLGAQQSMGSFYDLVNTLITITTVSLTFLTTSSSGTTKPPSSTSSLVENVKSRVQAAGCKVRQQAAPLFTRRNRTSSLPRLASVHSLTF